MFEFAVSLLVVGLPAIEETEKPKTESPRVPRAGCRVEPHARVALSGVGVGGILGRSSKKLEGIPACSFLGGIACCGICWESGWGIFRCRGISDI